MSTVIEQLDVNWVRLLINQFFKETTLISLKLEGGHVVKIEANRVLHHGMKISYMLLNRLPNHAWTHALAIPEDQLVPHS